MDHARHPFSDRSDTEQALLSTQARHSAVLDAAFDAIVTMDHGGRIIDFNGAAEQMGTWTLNVQDDSPADTGTLTAWSLTLTGPPPLPVELMNFEVK